MKKLILCLTLLLTSLSNYAQICHIEDFVDAIGISTSGVNIFYGFTTEYITPTSPVNPTLARILQSEQQKIVLFVDEEPEKGWEHKCSYYYTSMTTINGQIFYYKVSATVPRGDYDLMDYEVSYSKDRIMANVPYCNLNPNQINSASHTYAVILSGGINKYSNHSRYWNDCSFIYQTLTRRFGIPKNQISVLMADGTDPEEDMIISYGGFSSSPTDLDGDGYDDIQYAATKQNLTSVLHNLANVMTPKDNLFLYVIDHGGTDDYAGTSYICLWNKQKIYDYELAEILNTFDVKSMNIVLGQCFSGGFIDNLSAPNRVIATACNKDEYSWACSNINYDEFVYHWTSAINEANSLGVYADSDSNHDGFVSMREAFNYANKHDTASETPQFDSPNPTLAETLAFNAELLKYQLVVRDNIDDDGSEPNTTTIDAWSSPDLWTRNQPDGIEHPYHESINIHSEHLYTYVRIKNIGQKTYNENDGIYVHLFWAPASLGLTDLAWNGNTDMGGSLPPRKLKTVIQPDSSCIFVYEWNVPDIIIDSVEISGEALHVCHLVALSTSTKQRMPLPLINGSHVVDVLGHNWIAQRNIAFYTKNDVNSSKELPLYVRNVYDTPREYSIELLPVDEDNTDLSKIETTIRLSAPLFTSWENGGSQAKKAVTYKALPEIFHMQNADSGIENIKLIKGQREKIYCKSNIVANEDITEEKVYKYNIVQRDKLTGDIVGGERIEVQVKPRKAIIPVINQTQENGQIKLIASNVNEAALYEWYDSDGYKVGEGQEITVLPNNKEYKLKVCAESDAAINYATTIVKHRQGIESINPIPFKERVNIKLLSPADNNTYISITPVSSIGEIERYKIEQGMSEFTIFTSNSGKGTYLISLIQDGTVVDNKQITKK